MTRSGTDSQNEDSLINYEIFALYISETFNVLFTSAIVFSVPESIFVCLLLSINFTCFCGQKRKSGFLEHLYLHY